MLCAAGTLTQFVRRRKKAFVSRDPVSQFEKSSVEEGDVKGATSSDPPAEDWPSMNMHSLVSDAATIILITTCARWRDHPCTIPARKIPTLHILTKF
jgi:hypothetical protein